LQSEKLSAPRTPRLVVVKKELDPFSTVHFFNNQAILMWLSKSGVFVKLSFSESVMSLWPEKRMC
jgi:hypothetical protein